MARKAYIHVTIPMIRRMRELRSVGLGAEAISRVIGLDYGERPSRPTVQRHAPRPPGMRAAGVTRPPTDPSAARLHRDRAAA